jgi:hypothetical protein
MNGQYDTSLEGSRGIIPGPHQVRITAFEEEPQEEQEDETLRSLAKPPLFVGYTIDSDLKAGENSFEIPETAKGFGMGTGQPAARANDP